MPNVASALDAIIFDLDGTLIDSAPDLQASANAMLAAAGRPPLTLEAVAGMIGDGIPALVARAFAATGPAIEGEALAPWVERFLAVYADPSRPTLTTVYPGVTATLAAIRRAGIRTAVATNKQQEATELVLRETGLAPLIEVAVGGRPALRAKPDPAALLAALEALGVRPERAVMVGDSPNDVRAARAAGLRVVAVAYGYTPVPPAELGADRLIARFDELPQALAGL